MRLMPTSIKCLVALGLVVTLMAISLGLSSPVAAQTGPDTLTDPDITFAVENELVFEESLSLNDITVSTTDGIVTLTGVVDNLLAKERAARVAETVKGVRAVVNQLTVEPVIIPTDADLVLAVENALILDSATESYEINVLAVDGVVTLTGTVQSWQEKELAEDVAKSVQGVTEVINDIEIIYALERPDAEIQEEVVQVLRRDAFVDDGLIEVDVQNGEVILSGVVGSAAEKRYAITDAWVTGVLTVDAEDLTVERWTRDSDLREDKYVIKTDAELEQAVQDALQIDPRTNAFDIEIDANAGVVTLRGVVDNLRAKRAAAQDARRTVGVVDVTNRLRIQPTLDRPDDEIAADVREALALDPDVSRFEIAVDVINGTVYLSGNVDSYFEKGEADDIASRINGVTTVRNNLVVNTIDSVITYDPYIYETYYPYDYSWYDYQPYYTFTSDAEIEDDIKDELWWSPFVESDEVEVTVDNGIVTLTGTVDTWSERTAATENAYEGGATWVYNNLVVAPQ